MRTKQERLQVAEALLAPVGFPPPAALPELLVVPSQVPTSRCDLFARAAPQANQAAQKQAQPLPGDRCRLAQVAPKRAYSLPGARCRLTATDVARQHTCAIATIVARRANAVRVVDARALNFFLLATAAKMRESPRPLQPLKMCGGGEPTKQSDRPSSSSCPRAGGSSAAREAPTAAPTPPPLSLHPLPAAPAASRPPRGSRRSRRPPTSPPRPPSSPSAVREAPQGARSRQTMARRARNAGR